MPAKSKLFRLFGYVRPLRYFLTHFVLPINFEWCGLKLYFAKGGFILEDIFSLVTTFKKMCETIILNFFNLAKVKLKSRVKIPSEIEPPLRILRG